MQYICNNYELIKGCVVGKVSNGYLLLGAYGNSVQFDIK